MKMYDSANNNLLNSLENFETSINENHIWLGLAYFWYGKNLIEFSKLDEAENYIK